MSADGFECEWCHRCFGSKRGLGVHQRAKHPNEYHSKALDELKEKKGREVKKRWTELEVTRMANEEARILYYKGSIPNMNEEISRVITGRTIEVIKGKRRPAAYKKRVQDILRSFSPDSPQGPSTSSSSDGDTIQHLEAPPRLSRSPLENLEDYNLLEETEIYMSPDIYLNKLNSYQRVRRALTEDEKYSDEALLSLDDVSRCKHLINTYLLTIIKEDQTEKKVSRSRMPVGGSCAIGNLRGLSIQNSNDCILKTGKAYDSLYSNTSIGRSLEVDTVFSFWKHLLTHVAIYEPDPNEILFEEAPVTFVRIYSSTQMKWPSLSQGASRRRA